MKILLACFICARRCFFFVSIAMRTSASSMVNPNPSNIVVVLNTFTA